jgi:hypothetical protein
MVNKGRWGILEALPTWTNHRISKERRCRVGRGGGESAMIHKPIVDLLLVTGRGITEGNGVRWERLRRGTWRWRKFMAHDTIRCGISCCFPTHAGEALLLRPMGPASVKMAEPSVPPRRGPCLLWRAPGHSFEGAKTSNRSVFISPVPV